MSNIAIIGMGNISKRHNQNIKKLCPDDNIYTVPSRQLNVRQNVREDQFFVPNIESLCEIKLKFAIVASPAPFHADHTIPLILSGTPVLVEKPAATKVSDISRMIQASKSSNTPVAVGYCLRYLESLNYMKSLLQSGICGNIYNVSIEVGQYLPSWRPNVDYRHTVSAQKILGGGALNELSHEIDYAQYLFGELKIINSNLRSSKDLFLDVEDLVDIVATNDDGILCNIHLDFLQKKATRFCKVIGTNCTIYWDLIENKIFKLDPNGKCLLFSSVKDGDPNQKYVNMILDFFKIIRTIIVLAYKIPIEY